MTNPELFELLDRFEQSTLRSMKLSAPGFTLELERGNAAVSAPLPSAAAVPAQKENAQTIDAPLVGTFYAAPAPGQPPFVSSGTRVSKGQTVCLIEAMKMMSEVPAPCDCIIEEVLKADGQLAAFGDPLFRYTPC
ncbi:MAG: acetyl-CoA carboxylase biotin carboxyl carrier protein subunit [Oscillospiraceae bacterium]|nr:acetyl-CoA carboxylase biotin carboxyl carrier protein subunit [Oscillospiraceae bacterium]